MDNLFALQLFSVSGDKLICTAENNNAGIVLCEQLAADRAKLICLCKGLTDRDIVPVIQTPFSPTLHMNINSAASVELKKYTSDALL